MDLDEYNSKIYNFLKKNYKKHQNWGYFSFFRKHISTYDI